MLSLAQQGGERGVDPARGPPGRDDDERAPARGERRRHGPGDLLGPLGAGQRRPHRPRRTALGQGAQKALAPFVAPPAAGLGRRRRGRRRVRRAGLGAGVPGRHRQLQHVGEAARVPVGDGAGEVQQLGAENGFRRHDLGEGGQRPGVVGLGDPLDQKAVDEAPALAPPLPHRAPPGAEPHAHPHPGLRGFVQFLGHGVVEVPVEVQHTLVDEHPGHRQLLGQRRTAPGARLGPGHPGLAHALADQRELLRRRTLTPGPRRPVLAAHTSILTKGH